jgi:hypothetical protein
MRLRDTKPETSTPPPPPDPTVVPATVCIRHGRHLPCKPFQDAPDCLTTSSPVMVAMVGAYQANPGAGWDFEHVVKSWLYMQKAHADE